MRPAKFSHNLIAKFRLNRAPAEVFVTEIAQSLAKWLHTDMRITRMDVADEKGPGRYIQQIS